MQWLSDRGGDPPSHLHLAEGRGALSPRQPFSGDRDEAPQKRARASQAPQKGACTTGTVDGARVAVLQEGGRISVPTSKNLPILRPPRPSPGVGSALGGDRSAANSQTEPTDFAAYPPPRSSLSRPIPSRCLAVGVPRCLRAPARGSAGKAISRDRRELRKGSLSPDDRPPTSREPVCAADQPDFAFPRIT